MVEKVIRDGKVAVLYSPGYGAWWSTWAGSRELEEFALFDKRLVEMAESGATQEEVEKYLDDKFNDARFHAGGWRDIAIKWFDVGERFRVLERDGNERIEIIYNDFWIA